MATSETIQFATTARTALLPDWCNVYAGLTDEQIAVLEQAIRRRLDFARKENQPLRETHLLEAEQSVTKFGPGYYR